MKCMERYPLPCRLCSREERFARGQARFRFSLQRFADGDRVGAWPVIEELMQASVRARMAGTYRPVTDSALIATSVVTTPVSTT